jgi:hypothetical protein
MPRCFSVADCCYHDGSRNAYRQIDYVAIISVEVQKVPVARSHHRKNELVLKQTDPGNCNCLGQELDSKGVQPHLADAALLRALSITGIEFRSMMVIVCIGGTCPLRDGMHRAGGLHPVNDRPSAYIIEQGRTWYRTSNGSWPQPVPHRHYHAVSPLSRNSTF